MAQFDETSPRRIIPRWRVAKDATGAAERIPVPLAQLPPQVDVEVNLAEASEAWRRQPSIGTALDLLSTAHLLQAFDAGREAADFILKQTMVPAIAVSLANAVVARKRTQPPSHIGIRGSKTRLRSQLNNPLLLVDLARHYSSIGQNKKADRYMQMALRFAPNHRFVLRSAARLLVHMDEPDRAHGLFTNNLATPADPWLLAAEISIATVADRKSRYLKRGQELLKSARFSPDQITELSSALGTVELAHGKAKVAGQLFSHSLEQPNDNSLAQAEWAMRRHKLALPVLERIGAVPKTFEADFWIKYQSKDLENAKSLARAWRDDEPFSVRPAIMGQFTASIAEDYELAKQIGREGLIANPDHPQLIQNLVFAEAMTGNLSTAWSLLSRHASDDSVQTLANLGLIAYRCGYIELGRKCYEASVRSAKRTQDPHYLAMAEANFAREAFLAGDPTAQEIVRRAEVVLAKTPLQLVGAQLVWERTQRYLRREIHPKSVTDRADEIPKSDPIIRILEHK